MPLTSDRQYRAMPLLSMTGEKKRIESNYYVEGYATTFAPYQLYETEDGPIYERFLPDCFVGCDMRDIIMQYDHAGRVFARQSNKSLIVETDGTGLFVCADLGLTSTSKSMYEDIAAGLVTKMSWAFLPDQYFYKKETRTIIHEKVKKIYDVSAVSIPANGNTHINARSFGDGAIATVMQELQERETRKRKLKLLLEVMK